MRTAISSLVLLAAACASEAEPTATVSVTLRNDAAPDALTASDGTAWSYVLAPGVLLVHGPDAPSLFAVGEAASPELIALAEDGENTPLFNRTAGHPDVVFAGRVGAGDAYATAPIEPGQSATASFSIVPTPGLQLSFATMFAQSNDIFLAPADGALVLVAADGERRSGDLTAELALFDAGSELNEEPGIGPAQAPRQSAAGEGTDESEPVARLTSGTDRQGFEYPAIVGNITLEITWRND